MKFDLPLAEQLGNREETAGSAGGSTLSMRDGHVAGNLQAAGCLMTGVVFPGGDLWS